MKTVSKHVLRDNGDDEFKDGIIHALYLRLVAERETREAIAEAARNGASPEVIEAMASDPLPEIDKFGKAKTVRALVRRFREIKARGPARNLDRRGDGGP